MNDLDLRRRIMDMNTARKQDPNYIQIGSISFRDGLDSLPIHGSVTKSMLCELDYIILTFVTFLSTKIKKPTVTLPTTSGRLATTHRTKIITCSA